MCIHIRGLTRYKIRYTSVLTRFQTSGSSGQCADAISAKEVNHVGSGGKFIVSLMATVLPENASLASHNGDS